MTLLWASFMYFNVLSYFNVNLIKEPLYNPQELLMAFKMELTFSSLVPASSLRYRINLEILELAKIPVSVFDPSPLGSIYRVSGTALNSFAKVGIFRLNHTKLCIFDIWPYLNYKNSNSTLLQRELKHWEIKYLNTKLGIWLQNLCQYSQYTSGLVLVLLA